MSDIYKYGHNIGKPSESQKPKIASPPQLRPVEDIPVETSSCQKRLVEASRAEYIEVKASRGQ